ncbi:MAG: oxidoreductase [Sciscionella sp.]
MVIGLGRAGSGLHLPVLGRIRDSPAASELFAKLPIVACEPGQVIDPVPPGVVLTRSVEQAARLVAPEQTVAHVCTPPLARLGILHELATLGFRKIIVEKPLAVGTNDLEKILRLRDRFSLDIEVVAHWLTAELTLRLAKLVRDNTVGPLRSISVTQHKPRFRRSLSTHGHPTAFDVEVPHSVGVALRLAGAAELVDASSQAMSCGDTVLPRLGGARLTLRHSGGVRTDIVSDLTSPVRERRITLDFEHATATGHYPLGDEDEYAQLSVTTEDNREHTVFRDDALTAFLLRSYARFHQGGGADDDFGLHCDVVRLLCAAKSHPTSTSPTMPSPRTAAPEHAS